MMVWWGLAATVALSAFPAQANAQRQDRAIESAVVSIEVTQQRGDWYTPWQFNRPFASTGSGFLIGKNRVMTNAHVVSDARQIILRRNGNNTPYFAKVEFIAHDSDLALLRVEDPAFSKGVKPLKLGGLPSLRSRVRTYGFPAGGEKISRTEGVVSRIEFITYVHTGADSHLGIQTDSAINPGNSGGPVIQEGKVVGVAFQTNTRLNDVGFLIPVPLVKRFLKDIKDGRYDGYADLGAVTSNLINPVYRRYLGMKKGMSGVVVDRVMKNASAEKSLKPNDVLMAIDGVPIENDGTIKYHGYSLNYQQIAEEKLAGEKVALTLWRNRKKTKVRFSLKLLPDYDIRRQLFDTLPNYMIFSGLVFTELNQEFLSTFGNYWENADKHLLYQHFFQPIENQEKEISRVVMSRVLPHGINSAYRKMANVLLTEINGKPIIELGDIEKALSSPKDGFHKFTFSPGGLVLVMDAQKAAQAHQQILNAYGIREFRRLP